MTDAKTLNSSVDFANFSSILSLNEGNSRDNEVIEGLRMKIEDFRSYHLKKTFKEIICMGLNESLDRYVNYPENSSFINKDNYECCCNSSYEKSRYNTLERINDYFFSNIELIQTMEEQYKCDFDKEYQCDRYKDFIRMHIKDHEIESLKKERLKVQETQSKLKKKKLELDQVIKNYKKSKEEIDNIISLRQKEIDQLKINNESLKGEIANYEKKRKELEEAKTRHTSRTESILSQSPTLTPRLNLYDKNDDSHEYIEIIKAQISKNNNPTDIAIKIIEDVKEQIKLYNKHWCVDKVEQKFMSDELRVRKDYVNQYLKSENMKLLSQERSLDNRMKIFDSVICDKNEKADDRTYIKKSFERIIRERKEIDDSKTELISILNVVKGLEFNINNSIRLYKEAYGDLLTIYKAIDSKLKTLSILVERYFQQ
ncbi:hypothetical protein SteCoe_4168 [Stentor coeruleus]|uniref:Uncharacterized protein n=1 Tax=Stentor coeruleus TaxID=5963 RepID=A0A1R2CVF0_9CILI|nr:hypothetical protein SteCoe_4168 [Stentor coeruleus]